MHIHILNRVICHRDDYSVLSLSWMLVHFTVLYIHFTRNVYCCAVLFPHKTSTSALAGIFNSIGIRTGCRRPFHHHCSSCDRLHSCKGRATTPPPPPPPLRSPDGTYFPNSPRLGEIPIVTDMPNGLLLNGITSNIINQHSDKFLTRCFSWLKSVKTELLVPIQILIIHCINREKQMELAK